MAGKPVLLAYEIGSERPVAFGLRVLVWACFGVAAADAALGAVEVFVEFGDGFEAVGAAGFEGAFVFGIEEGRAVHFFALGDRDEGQGAFWVSGGAAAEGTRAQRYRTGGQREEPGHGGARQSANHERHQARHVPPRNRPGLRRVTVEACHPVAGKRRNRPSRQAVGRDGVICNIRSDSG